MDNTWTREWELRLEEQMTGREFLTAMGWKKKDLILILRQAAFRRGLQALMRKNRFTCRDILSLAQATMSILSPEPEQGWLLFSYEYGKHTFYPENFPDVARPEYEKGYRFFMEFLHAMLDIEEQAKGFLPTMYFSFAGEDELKNSGIRQEYRIFREFCRKNYLVEFMRLGTEVTPFNTLGHIAGVHHIAMSMARQLSAMGVQVDLPLMSGAAIGHDIGKFGCKESEARRVPYLHYYYTDQCLKRNHMPLIAHIAANHSTWDLELENLSVESLLLIYADFRVKSVRGQDKAERICFYSLAESFQVILNKLDNVDAAKQERYRRVYEKLADFEHYMVSLGVRTDSPDARPKRLSEKDSALLCGEAVVEAYKNSAIDHNIRLMHILNYESTFGNILESARSEKDWKNTRSYLNILEEYNTYMNQKQKLLSISFLYELLMHHEGDIRQKAATLMGHMIIGYDTEYRKEIPEGRMAFVQESSSLELFRKNVERILVPDHKITEKHREWLGYMLEYLINSVFTSCKPTKRKNYMDALMEFYKGETRDSFTRFIMMIALLKLPLAECGKANYATLMYFLEECAKDEPLQNRIALLRVILFCLKSFPENSTIRESCRELFGQTEDQPVISIRFLRHEVRTLLGDEPEDLEWLKAFQSSAQIIASCFLDNLKTGIHWISKQVNVEFLQYMMDIGINNQPVHTMMHLANLLTVSECGDVRRQAGQTLLLFAGRLSADQRNEVAVELLKGLELGENEFAKYIPEYLGPLILLQEPREADEFLESLESMFLHANDQTAGVILDTVGVMIENYPAYRENSAESVEAYEARKEHMLGFLLRGLAVYHEAIAQEAFYVVGEHIFASKKLSLEEKYRIFFYMGKKMFHIVRNQAERPLTFLIHAAALNHIYRFIADYSFENGAFGLSDGGRAAFFPGTFDPFSLSHRGIVEEIRRHGFEVYLAIDEFSWSKKTQPRLVRRKIAAMSVADDAGVFLFPDDVPVNIANPGDLKRLRALFPTKEVFIVVGNDVITHASAYRKSPVADSIHTFPHIIFRRNSEASEQEKEGSETAASTTIRGEILQLSLPVQLEDISSTRIRENIDCNRDISNLMDPIAQNYIYSRNLYLREPQYKPVIDAETLRFEAIPAGAVTEEQIEQLGETLFKDRRGREQILESLRLPETELVLIWGDQKQPIPSACAVFRHLPLNSLMAEFGNFSFATKIRKQIIGKVMLLSGLYVSFERIAAGMAQLLLTETLAYALAEEYTCCIYHGLPDREGRWERRGLIEELLKRQGFLRIEEEGRDDLVMAVDMHMPTTLTKNLSMVIKAPFNTNPQILRTLESAHRRLQAALTQLRPGHLVLSFDSNIMHRRLVEKITKENGVPSHVVIPRTLGEKMCVPFGKMLRGSVVPNTVTKTVHTERVFHTDMSGFSVEEFPGYSPLRTQIRTIKSFDRSAVLVDDLLHKGYRLRNVYHFFEEEEVPVSKLMLGLLTGWGKDLAESLGIPVDSVYFLPNLHSWYVESTMYPFIGGDSVRGGTRTRGLITSVNLILPYVSPAFLIKESMEVAYHVSMVCLENARDILQALEREYQKAYEKNLTLDRLSEVIYSPTCPDKGDFMRYDVNLPASLYIENDIQRLLRLKNIAVYAGSDRG